jgi:hypothetical protein
MALNFPDNRYPGVNAHLNSYMQQRNGTWSSFHAKFANSIQELLDSALPSNYYAALEQGLQISEIGLERVYEKRSKREIQVSKSSEIHNAEMVSAPTATFPLFYPSQLDDEDDILIRVSIYQSEPNNVSGKLITAIEILSFENKPTTDYYPFYFKERKDLLKSGINLVEIDLLHESMPVISQIPAYENKADNSYPYYVGISRPQPNFQTGIFEWYGINVDAPLPKIDIPLASNETVLLDFNLAYNAAFKGARLYSMLVDYEKLPVNFERYSATDQQRIKDMLERIRKDLN